MTDVWKIDWNPDDWVVELSRFLATGKFIEVRMVYKSPMPEYKKPAICECTMFRPIGNIIRLRWPWEFAPNDPSEVIAMAKHLAGKHLEAPR